MHSPAFSAYTCNTICSAHIKIEQFRWWMRCRETVKLNVVISLLFISNILISKQYWLELQQFAALQSHFSLFRFVWVCKLRVQSKVSRNSAIAHRMHSLENLEQWHRAQSNSESWRMRKNPAPKQRVNTEKKKLDAKFRVSLMVECIAKVSHSSFSIVYDFPPRTRSLPLHSWKTTRRRRNKTRENMIRCRKANEKLSKWMRNGSLPLL